MQSPEPHETPLEWARALLARLNPTGIEDSAALAASVCLPYFWHENGDLCCGDPTDDRDNYSATELYDDYILEACNNYPRVLGDLAMVRAEYKCTLFVLGEGYTEELEIHPDKRRPLDSMVDEVIRQKDNELDELRTAAAALVAVLRKRHHGRMPDEVQRAYDAVLALTQKEEDS